MPTPVFMPKFEMTQETGTVLAWIKDEGDHVEKGEPILEIETDKATMEVESPATGILSAISAQPGQVVPIATPIAHIFRPGEPVPAAAEPPAPAGDPESTPGNGGPARVTPVAARLAEHHDLDLEGIGGTGPRGRITRQDVEAVLAAPDTTMPAAPDTMMPAAPDTMMPAAPDTMVPGAREAQVRAVPAARRLARELGVDLGAVAGTGPGGRIQSADVAAAAHRPEQEAARTPAAPPPVTTGELLVVGTIATRRVVPLTHVRRTIAERMTASVREAPQFTVAVDADMGRALDFVQDLKAGADESTPKVTLTALLVKACAWALRQHPEVNASFQGEAIVEWDEVNVGVATAVDQGLIVPVVRGADGLGLRGIAAQLTGLIGRARDGKPRLDDLQGGTFTLSNLGMFGIDRFTAILNPPQAAILAVGRVSRRLQVGADDQIEIRPMASLALTADHRVLDGATAARFLATLQRALEHPGLLLE